MPASNCGAGRAARPWPSETMPGYCRAGNRLPMQAGTGGLGAAGKAENGGGGVAPAFRPAQRDAEASLHSVAAAERLARLALSALSAERLTLGGGGVAASPTGCRKGRLGASLHTAGRLAGGILVPPDPAAFRRRQPAAPQPGGRFLGTPMGVLGFPPLGGFRRRPGTVPPIGGMVYGACYGRHGILGAGAGKVEPGSQCS